MLCFHISNQIYIIIQTCMPAHLKINKIVWLKKLNANILSLKCALRLIFFLLHKEHVIESEWCVIIQIYLDVKFTWTTHNSWTRYTPLPLPITHSTDNLSDTYPVMQIYMSTGITGKIHGQDTLASIGTRGENIRLYPDTAASHVGFVTGVIDSCWHE